MRGHKTKKTVGARKSSPPSAADSYVDTAGIPIEKLMSDVGPDDLPVLLEQLAGVLNGDSPDSDVDVDLAVRVENHLAALEEKLRNRDEALMVKINEMQGASQANRTSAEAQTRVDELHTLCRSIERRLDEIQILFKAIPTQPVTGNIFSDLDPNRIAEQVKAELAGTLTRLIREAVADAVPRRSPNDARAHFQSWVAAELGKIAANPSPLHDDNRELANELCARAVAVGVQGSVNANECFGDIADGIVNALGILASQGNTAVTAMTQSDIETDPYGIHRQGLAEGSADSSNSHEDAPRENAEGASTTNDILDSVTLAIARQRPSAVARFIQTYRITAAQNPGLAPVYRLLLFAGRTETEIFSLAEIPLESVRKGIRIFQNQFTYYWHQPTPAS